jgi:hypothetical protein
MAAVAATKTEQLEVSLRQLRATLDSSSSRAEEAVSALHLEQQRHESTTAALQTVAAERDSLKSALHEAKT